MVTTSVWVIDRTGRNRRKVIANGRRPDWSPNGRLLAYVRDDGVYLAQANGHHQRRIIRNTQGREFSFVRWSPNGSLLALTTDERDIGRLYVRPPGGGRLQRLFSHARHAPVAWAPDGRRVATHRCSDDGATGTIIVFQVAQRAVEKTVGTPRCPYVLAWSPDGASIAYCWNAGIDRVRLEDGQTRAISDPSCQTGLAWQRAPGSRLRG